MLHHAIAAEPDNECDADRTNEIDEREKDGVIKDRFDVRLAMLVVNSGKPLNGFLFCIEYLNCLGARDVFLQESKDARDARAHRVKTASRTFPKPSRRDK